MRTFGFKLADAPIGDYEIVMAIRDDLAGRSIEMREPFKVVELLPASAMPRPRPPRRQQGLRRQTRQHRRTRKRRRAGAKHAADGSAGLSPQTCGFRLLDAARCGQLAPGRVRHDAWHARGSPRDRAALLMRSMSQGPKSGGSAGRHGDPRSSVP
jgi:hypothetical protein